SGARERASYNDLIWLMRRSYWPVTSAGAEGGDQVERAADDGARALARHGAVEPRAAREPELVEHPQRGGVAVVGCGEDGAGVVRRRDDLAQVGAEHPGTEPATDMGGLADEVVDAHGVL